MSYGDRMIFIGYDDREVLPFAVARHSFKTWSDSALVCSVAIHDLLRFGWYDRPTEIRPTKQGGEVLWDLISDAPMSTQFAISRFFTPLLAERQSANCQWALFVDCDVFARRFVDDLFLEAEQNPDKALFCVPHQHTVVEGEVKKEAQIQTNYNRKNWSSVMLFNMAHRANDVLTPEYINKLPGRDLHRFCWLKDDEIGFLDKRWNHLVGVDGAQSPDPAIVHFTNGGPWLKQYENVEYANEWRAAMYSWAR